MRPAALLFATVLDFGCASAAGGSGIHDWKCPTGLNETRTEVGGAADTTHLLVLGCEVAPDVSHGATMIWDLHRGYLWMLLHFENGVAHGPALSWHENGRLWQTSTYIDGVQQGRVSVWRLDGSLQATGRYEDGQLDGSFERFAEH